MSAETYLFNDRDQRVLVVGEPGSVERAQCEWPKVIDRLRKSKLKGKLNRGSAAVHFACCHVVLITDRVACLMAVGLSEDEAKAMGGAVFK
jgi:hypothetical protein